MIKTIIFDLDGVLVDTKIVHFKALNVALKKYENFEISFNEHTNLYDGLPTNEKLKILVNKKKISKNNIEKIANLKKKNTNKLLKKEVKFSKKLYNLFRQLSKKYKIAIATNAIESTLRICIKILKINKFVNFKISNQRVTFAKPHPEIYLRCLINLGAKPNETLILEDSHYGREAAKESGCHIMPIKKLNEVNLRDIKLALKFKKNRKYIYSTPWIDNKINILIPMAGRGNRFVAAGYTFPKPLIEIKGKPMIQRVIENINIQGNYIFIIQKEHQKKYNIKSLLNILKPDCKIIELDHFTEGAACTTLLAKDLINNNSPLVLANSDQYVDWDSNKTMYNFTNKNFDGGILTFEALHPKWSYARLSDKTDLVTEVAEKKVISNNATVGIYYWKKGSDYIKYAEDMISKNIRVNNEFYVCPVYNQAIKDGKKIAISKVDTMYGLGTPEDLNNFLQTKIYKEII
jgi:HAD superfamily hydrolase (TIGR01509 family)